MWKDFLQLFTAHTCLSCENELTRQEECVCLSCLSQIPQTGFHLSPKDSELYYRFAGKIPIAGAASLFYFDKAGRLQTILKELKYKELPQVGVFLGKLYGEILKGSEFVADIDALIPVPLHRAKLIKRGYNQAERIAFGMSEVLRIPVMENGINRSRKTLTQTRKSGEARWENVAGAFEVKVTLPKSVLLIDDVITTGATIEAVIRAFSDAASQPDSIRIASIGMARKH